MPEPISELEVAHVEQALADIPPQFDNERLPEAKAFNPWIVAIVVTIGTFMEVLDTSIANVALPHIAGNLSASLDEGRPGEVYDEAAPPRRARQKTTPKEGFFVRHGAGAHG